MSCQRSGCPRPMRKRKGGKRTTVEKTENQNNVTVDSAILSYANPYFVPIEDGDEETIKHYKRNNVPVAHIALPRRMRHYYAIFDAATKEEADFMNRIFNNWSRKDERDKVAREKFETSYEILVERGFDQKSTGDNPEEIVAYSTVIEALYKALGELTSEKLRACKMVANEESQRSVAEELGIPRRTLRDHKDKAMAELEKKMIQFK